MTKTRRTYTREFKHEAVHLLETSGKSTSHLERELGIGGGCLFRWKRELAEEGKSAFRGHGHLMPDQEHIRQLERENEILRQERDILKKHAYCPDQPEQCHTGSSGKPWCSGRWYEAALNDSTLAQQLARQAYKDVHQYTWQKRARRILDHFQIAYET